MLLLLKLGENRMEEMAMCSMDQCHKLGLGSVLVGDEGSKFKIQTGEDFSDCDVLGKIVQFLSVLS